MSPQDVLRTLLDGNKRFRTGEGTAFRYTQPELETIAQSQAPIAAVVACADSRLTPEVIFDQPLGSLFVSRVPGNVASDSAQWMIDIAVMEFTVPLLVVLGHTGCLAVAQVARGQVEGTGGSLRHMVARAVQEARQHPELDLETAAIQENARQTVRDLADQSAALRTALFEHRILCVSAVYHMTTGEVRVLDPRV